MEVKSGSGRIGKPSLLVNQWICQIKRIKVGKSIIAKKNIGFIDFPSTNKVLNERKNGIDNAKASL